MRAPATVRAGLILLAITDVAQGFWQYFLPRSFYEHVPTVALNPPFSAHLMTDVGGLNLAMAVVLGASAIIMERHLVITALTAYLVYAVSHLLFHVTHLTGFTAADMALTTTGLGVLAAAPAALLVAAVWKPAPRPEGSGRRPSSAPGGAGLR